MHLEEYDLEFDGKWQDGYRLIFHDKKLHIKGNLTYEAINPKGVLVYYNNLLAMTPSMAQ